MNFLKNLFSGTGRGSGSKSLFLYVRPKACTEILPIRIELTNELSKADDGKTYHVRKVTKVPRCPFEVEVTLYFDQSKKLVERTIENGEFVSEEEYKEHINLH